MSQRVEHTCYSLGWGIKVHLFNSGGRDTTPRAIIKVGDVDRFVEWQWRKVFWGAISVDRVFRRKEDVEEKIKCSFWCDPSDIPDRDSTSSERRGEVDLRCGSIERTSALLTPQLARVDLAFREVFMRVVECG